MKSVVAVGDAVGVKGAGVDAADGVPVLFVTTVGADTGLQAVSVTVKMTVK